MAVRRPTRREAEDAVRTLICWAGDDPNRAGIVSTPSRVLGSLRERLSGYGEGSGHEVKWEFEGASDGAIVVVREIQFVSQCEHHMMPFVGQADIAYLPAERMAAEKSLHEVVTLFARRLQSQERLTAEILAAIDDALRPRGTAILVQSEHLCMTARGVRAHGSTTVTMKFSGALRGSKEAEVLDRLLANGKRT